MSKKRAGFQAAANLASIDDASIWERVEAYLPEVIDSIPGLAKYQGAATALAETISKANSSDESSISKHDLEQVIGWKHRVGKNRAYNMKHILANTDAAIENHSRAAFALARTIDNTKCTQADHGCLTESGRSAIIQAMAELENLKGVGPATASAILAVFRPDIFCYMYDEVIDCFETQRDYKAKQYVRVNDYCLQLSQTLGPAWTTSRVATALWTAARYSAIHGKDLTQISEQKGTVVEGKSSESKTKLSRKRRLDPSAQISDSLDGQHKARKEIAATMEAATQASTRVSKPRK